MTNQSVWIGITVGVFFAGLAIGFVAFSNTMTVGNMPMHNQQSMMMGNSDTMQVWMQDPQHVEEMGSMMRENHDFAMEMMYTIIEDPTIRLQMLGHMTENQDTMEQMMNMMGSRNMMGSGMMHQEMMSEMLEDPETKEMMIQSMTKHIEEMDMLLSSELSDEEFNMKMTEIMNKHMVEMQQIMASHSNHHAEDEH